MPGPPPAGEPAPRDGSLPAGADQGLGRQAFGIYVHVPFCQTRCGYCDFNTYTAAEQAMHDHLQSVIDALRALAATLR